LYEADLLAAYVTTFHYDRNTALGRFLRTALRAAHHNPEEQLCRRRITEVPQELVRSYPWPEFLRMLASKVGPITTDLVWEHTEKWFDTIVARHHLEGTAAVYGYEHACFDSFTAQKRRGGLCIYEMPITHHNTTSEILYAEFDKYPETVTKRDLHLRRLAWRRNERKDRELQLADLVIANSSFTKQSLIRAGVHPETIAVVPLGAPPPASRVEKLPGPFIFLSAGTQSVRKGVHYLLEAWRRLAPPKGDVQLWLVGHMSLPERLLKDLPGTVIVKESLPKSELFGIYQRSGALVFPSLCEGFGMVITEAMSQGLPVITTQNTAGPDLIQHGRNGFLVPIRDVDRLCEVMQWCVVHRNEMKEIGREAATTAARWQWSDYRAALGRVVMDFLAGPRQQRNEKVCLVGN
jgi:glycosyltransferase involved in cell wall biosynthesis